MRTAPGPTRRARSPAGWSTAWPWCLAADSHPDFRTISDCRRRHLAALAALFEQVVRLSQKAAETADRQEDQRPGAARPGEDLPAELERRASRLQKLAEATAALEAEARERAPAEGRDADAARPADKAQRNFTDPESKIQKTSTGFIQGYHAQARVDGAEQIIVALHVTACAADAGELPPAVEAIVATSGAPPQVVLAAAGYFSEANVAAVQAQGSDPLIATGRPKHGEAGLPAPRGRPPPHLTPRERMARRLRALRGRALYALRKQIVEPVFGQITHARGSPQFLLRGATKVGHEWALVCTAHNLRKLHAALGRA